MALDLYQRLGVQRGASAEEIKKAYRSLAKQLHPDRNKDKPDAAKRFGEITHAYDLLSDNSEITASIFAMLVKRFRQLVER